MGTEPTPSKKYNKGDDLPPDEQASTVDVKDKLVIEEKDSPGKSTEDKQKTPEANVFPVNEKEKDVDIKELPVDTKEESEAIQENKKVAKGMEEFADKEAKKAKEKIKKEQKEGMEEEKQKYAVKNADGDGYLCTKCRREWFVEKDAANCCLEVKKRDARALHFPLKIGKIKAQLRVRFEEKSIFYSIKKDNKEGLETKTTFNFYADERKRKIFFKNVKNALGVKNKKQKEKIEQHLKEILSEIQNNLLTNGQPKHKKEYFSIYVSNFELPEGKWLEEIIVEGEEKFVLYDIKKDSWEIVDDYLYGDTLTKPYIIGPNQQDAVIFPDGVEEYSTLEELRKEMLEFALEEYDPVDNKELFELHIILFLTSWISSLWQRHLSEKFIPIANARGPSETGKKRYLTVARYLTYHSLYMLKTDRVPTKFRAIAPIDGTLIEDEADMADSSLSSESVEFYNSRCDGVPITRYSTESQNNVWWKSFGLTVMATRKGFNDDGMESRCVVMPTATTDNPGDYNLIPPKEWTQKGKKLQRKLLLFRLRHLKGAMPTQLIIPKVSSFRVRESLLIIQKLKEEESGLFDNVSKLAIILQERIIKERAASPEGLILNIIYNELTDDNVRLEKHTLGYVIVKGWEQKKTNPDYDGEERVWRSRPLTLKEVNKRLGEAFSSSNIASMWRGMNQEIVQQKKMDNRRYRGVFLIRNLVRLDKIFPKYVCDYETPIPMTNEMKGKQGSLDMEVE